MDPILLSIIFLILVAGGQCWQSDTCLGNLVQLCGYRVGYLGRRVAHRGHPGIQAD